MNDEQGAVARDFLYGLNSAMRQNPLSSVLIGAGLVWLFAGGRNGAWAGVGGAREALGRSGARVGEGVQSFRTSAGEAFGSVGNSLKDGAAAIAEKTSDAASSITESARNLGPPTVGGQFFASARSNLSDLFDRQPFLLGAVGIAIGAATAAALPSTDTEVELLQDSSAAFRAKTKELAKHQMERASEVADGVVTTIAEEARVQGLMTDNLAKKALERGHSVRGIVSEATDSARSKN